MILLLRPIDQPHHNHLLAIICYSPISHLSMPKFINMKAKVGTCEKCCFSFATVYLQIVNLLDFLVACGLLSFSIFLYTKVGSDWSAPAISWLLWCSLFISILLFLISSLSFLALTSPSCRCCTNLTDVFAVMVVILDLAVGIASIKLKNLVLAYFTNHQESLGLTDSDLHTLKTWYLGIMFLFFLSLFLEALRVWCNRGYSDTAVRIDREYDSLLQEDERNWEKTLNEKQQVTSEKYKSLRNYYKQKYSKSDDNSSNSFNQKV
jgi:hypothetical protein